jgi:hypothetical protein
MRRMMSRQKENESQKNTRKLGKIMTFQQKYLPGGIPGGPLGGDIGAEPGGPLAIGGPP